MSRFKMLFLLLAGLAVTYACENDQAGFSYSNKPKGNSDIYAASKSNSLTRQKALSLINQRYADEFYPITLSQVEGLTAQQFNQWLLSTRLPNSEKQRLQPLFSSNGNEFVLLKNVQLRSGKKATIGMIGVVGNLQPVFTSAVAVVMPPLEEIEFEPMHCSFNKCRNGRCESWLFFAGACPPNQCFTNGDCDEENDLGDFGIETREVLSAF